MNSNEEFLTITQSTVTVELSQLGGESFISRSQAKRVLFKLERFKRITLDFKNVRIVGQGFVDQVFRVFQNKYPDIQINYIDANEDVEFMIKRGIATAMNLDRP